MRNSRSCVAPIETPPALAEPGDEPTARASYPSRVRRIRNQTTTAAPIARNRSQDRCAPGVTPKISPMSPTRPCSGNRLLRRSTNAPSGASLNLSGPLSAHARKLTAMPFIMIVVTTSCAPVRTFRIPGTAAHTIPPTIAAIRVADNRSGAREEAEGDLGPCGHHHREDVLPFDADVEQPALEADRDGERREDQGGGDRKHVADPVDRTQRRLEDRRVHARPGSHRRRGSGGNPQAARS